MKMSRKTGESVFSSAIRKTCGLGNLVKKGEREILALLDFKEVSALVLESSSRRKLYEKEELAGECALRLYLKPEDYLLTKGFLTDLGYETDRLYTLYGERMRRADGFCVELYDHFPYRSSHFKKQFRRLFEKAQLIGGYDFIYELDGKTRLTYLLAKASYDYVTERLLVRQLLDILSSAQKSGKERFWNRSGRRSKR